MQLLTRGFGLLVVLVLVGSPAGSQVDQVIAPPGQGGPGAGAGIYHGEQGVHGLRCQGKCLSAWGSGCCQIVKN
jgi:hypothetical protein